MAYDNSEFTAGEPVGVFQVTGGKMRVTDPCYETDTWCAGVLENVKDGEWEAYAFIEDYGSGMLGGERIKALSVKHRATDVKWNFPREVAKFEVGVDSGQAGFFDEGAYPQGERKEDGYWNKDDFYDKCCDATCGRDSKGEGYGIIDDRGVVSSSGWGDGGYTCTYARDEAGQIVAAMVEFIPDEDEIDDDEPERFACGECGDDFTEDELDDDSRCWSCAEKAAEAEAEEKK